MDFKELTKWAAQKVANTPGSTPRTYLDNTRRNLMSLLCLDEKLGLTGTVEDFGGATRLTDDIRKAVFNLTCLAEMFKLDLAAAFDAEYGPSPQEDHPSQSTPIDAKEKGEEKTGPSSSLGDGNSSAHQHSEIGGTPDGAGLPVHTDEAAAPTSSGLPEDKEQRLLHYKDAFKKATSIEEVKRIMTKEVGHDKSLDGPKKASLMNDYKEALKRLNRPSA